MVLMSLLECRNPNRGRKLYTSQNVLVAVDFDSSSLMCLLVGKDQPMMRAF
jgi:hypothetical protein